jgi:hypothetical protein
VGGEGSTDRGVGQPPGREAERSALAALALAADPDGEEHAVRAAQRALASLQPEAHDEAPAPSASLPLPDGPSDPSALAMAAADRPDAPAPALKPPAGPGALGALPERAASASPTQSPGDPAAAMGPTDVEAGSKAAEAAEATEEEGETAAHAYVPFDQSLSQQPPHPAPPLLPASLERQLSAVMGAAARSPLQLALALRARILYH